jgi:hypothetical protein
MSHDRALFKIVAVLAMSFITGLGCASEDANDAVALESTDNASDLAHPERACTSIVDESGLVCTTCGRGKDRTRECLPARCTPVDHCLRCTDPKGRVADDCSIDYQTVSIGAFSTPPSGSFSLTSCTFNWGAAKATGTTCYYPGADTCAVNEDEAGHALSCTYPDGSSTSIASQIEAPLPDPLIGRPDDLPAPGECITEVAQGSVCTTCARDDLSVTRSCHFPGIIACDILDADDACLADCTFADGSKAQLCNSPRGPVPVR